MPAALSIIECHRDEVCIIYKNSSMYNKMQFCQKEKKEKKGKFVIYVTH